MIQYEMSTRFVLLICLLSTGLNGICQAKPYPGWVTDSLKQKGLDKKYELNAYLKPGWLQDDFNGDGVPDVALLVADKATHKKGILLLTGKAPDYFVFGAGTHFGNGGMILDGQANGMNIRRRPPISPPEPGRH